MDALRDSAAKYHLDLSRVVVLGHSAGGQLALWAGGRKRIPRESPLHADNPLPLRGVVALAGIADMRGVRGARATRMRRRGVAGDGRECRGTARAL